MDRTVEGAVRTWSRWLGVLFLIYVLVVAVGLIGSGFKQVSGGADGAEAIFAFATNPLLAVILVLATTLVQSSSTVTSVIVGLVAGGMPMNVAVPMIMGANMGTTVTNTIVSMGNIRDGEAFNRSFAAATVHDFFNLYSIVIFLPLEIFFRPLERMSGVLARWMSGEGSASINDLNAVGMITDPAVRGVLALLDPIPHPFVGVLVAGLGVGLVITSVLLLGKSLRRAMTGNAQRMFNAALGRGPLLAIITGAAVTILVQSSSTTTSLIVPLAGAGVVLLEQAYPFTLGANVGTCVTALLAATAVTGEYETLALQIALVHLLYNVFGVAIFCSGPFLRQLPVHSARWLGRAGQRNRAMAFGYVFVVFFIVPGLILGGQHLLGGKSEEVLEAEAEPETLHSIELDVEKTGLKVE